MNWFFKSIYLVLSFQTRISVRIKQKYFRTTKDASQVLQGGYSITDDLTLKEKQLRYRIVENLLHPNVLTLSRLVAAFLLIPYLKPTALTALAVFVWGYISDLINGIFARKFDKKTRIGKYLDPLADRTLACLVLVFLFNHGQISGSLIAALLAFQIPFAVYTIARLIGKNLPDPRPNIWGRTAASLYVFGFLFLIVNLVLGQLSNATLSTIGRNLVVSGIVVTGFSIIIYSQWLWYEKRGTRFVSDVICWTKVKATFN